VKVKRREEKEKEEEVRQDFVRASDGFLPSLPLRRIDALVCHRHLHTALTRPPWMIE